MTVVPGPRRRTSLPLVYRIASVLWAAALASAAPASAGQLVSPTALATIEGRAELLQIQQGRLFVVAERTLRIFDVATPSRPVPVGGFTFGEHIRAFAVSQVYVYVLAEFHGIRILDVSNPASPMLRGSLPLRGGYYTVALFDNATLLATGLASGLQIIDVSNADAPALVASQFTDGYAQGVSVVQPLVYLMDDPTGLYVFDLSKPRSPRLVGLLELGVAQPPVPSEKPRLSSHAVAVSAPIGNRAIPIAAIVDKTGGLLEFYDVSRPEAPTRVGQHAVPVGTEALAVRESLAYLALGRDGLLIIDFSTPSRPTPAASIKTPHPAVDVQLSNSVVYVATGAGGVMLLGRK